MAGDVDAFPVYPAPENLSQFESDPRFNVVVGSTEGETILSTFGYGTPIGTHFAPHHPFYQDFTANSAYDPEKARALLAEAGFADGFETTLKLPPPSYARRGGLV